MPYYNVVAVFFAIIVLSSIVGICYFLIETGFYPPELEYNASSDTWEQTGYAYFSWLTLAGIIMLGVYLLPFVLRPIDFVTNFGKYLLGLIAYLFLLPMFTNVFQIYAMCNLHDVSWGNRPTSTGAEAFTADKAKQDRIKGDYMVFRTNFTFIWIVANGLYLILILWLVNGSGHRTTVNSGDFGYLEIFSLYLAALVVFRVLFAVLYILNWKFKYCCLKRYRIQYHDLQAEFKRIKSRTNAHGESTDDEEMEEQINTIFKTNEKAVRKKRKKGAAAEEEEEKEFNAHDATIEFMNDEGAQNPEDSDDDFREFEEADVEEAEDRVYNEYKKRKLEGKGTKQLGDEEIASLAGNVPLQDMDQSIVHSARQGSFVPFFKGADSSRYVDLSAIDKSISTAGPVSNPSRYFPTANKNRRRPGPQFEPTTASDIDRMENNNMQTAPPRQPRAGAPALASLDTNGLPRTASIDVMEFGKPAGTPNNKSGQQS